jgi:heat shock protein HslJ
MRTMLHRRMRAFLATASCAVMLCACGGTPATSNGLPPVTPIMIPPAMAASAEDDLIGGAWRWQAGAAGDATDRYTVEFIADGRVQVRADCNRGAGRYTAERDGRMSVTQIALTKMGCGAGSLDAQFARQLGEVERYRVERDALQLMLRGGGTMTLRR